MEQLYFSPMLLGICLLVAIALCASALYRTVPGEPGPGFWLAGCWSLIAGIVLFLIFVITRNPVLNVLGNALQLAGEALFLLGIFRFFGRRIPWWTLPASTGVMVLFNSWYWLTNGSSDLLMGVYSSIAGLLPLQAIALLLRESRDPATRPARLLVAIALVIYSAVTLLRGALGYRNWWLDAPYVQPYESFSYLLSYNFALPALVLGFVGCCLMTTQRVLDRSEQLAAQLQEQAIRDPLTGAFNRRAFHQQLADEVARSERYGRPLCLAIFDLDHFKQLNDELGHQAGDHALQHFSALCQQQARHSDLFARFGGEEFLVALPNTDLHVAAERAEQYRAALAGIRLDWQGNQLTSTVSLGVSVFPDHGTELDVLLRHADLALYRAKHLGRNQVVVFDADA